jgi:cyclohexanone monooxygenase
MNTVDVDVVVVGAGFAGLRALYTLREKGYRVAVLEAGDGIGGVWYFNRYPGARCDIESYDYSYSFSPELEQEWRWTQRYATQPEILNYIDHVADRFDLRPDIHLGRRVDEARWDDEATRWLVRTDQDETWSAPFLIWAVGNLSTTKQPDLPGLVDFTGEVLHTARWPREPVDVGGMRVGVIGTGSSGMQSVPILARQAAELTVFQRTANFSVPARHHSISDADDAKVKAGYPARRQRILESPSGLGFRPRREGVLEVSETERNQILEEAWNRAGFGFALSFRDILVDERANAVAADFIRAKIAEMVDDPEVRELLTPRDHPFGARRPVVDDGYFPTFNQENVKLVDVRSDPIVRATADGVQTASGIEYPLDFLVFATGFDALTGSLLRPSVIGRGGRTLAKAWAAGPRSYLGLGVAGFPNMFVVAGPGSPALLANVMVSIEMHVDWIAELLQHMNTLGASQVEANLNAEDAWGQELLKRAEQTLYPKARSYYMGDEVPGKPRVFMMYAGGLRNYGERLRECVRDSYSGFEFTKD